MEAQQINTVTMRKIVISLESYVGRKIGKSYMHRCGYQLVATDAQTGKRVYAFNSSPCLKFAQGAAHYRSGLSTNTRESFEYQIDNIKQRLDDRDLDVFRKFDVTAIKFK